MKIYAASALLGLLSGCVKLNLLPEDAIGKSVKATKNLYDEAQLKRSGGKKKEYEREVLISQYPTQLEAEKACLWQLKASIQQQSPQKPAVILTEKVVPAQSTIICKASAFIWQ